MSIFRQQCEALLTCHEGPNGQKRGEQCKQAAIAFLTDTEGGAHLACWVHNKAANNPDRRMPIRWVEK